MGLCVGFWGGGGFGALFWPCRRCMGAQGGGNAPGRFPGCAGAAWHLLLTHTTLTHALDPPLCACLVFRNPTLCAKCSA